MEEEGRREETESTSPPSLFVRLLVSLGVSISTTTALPPAFLLRFFSFLYGHGFDTSIIESVIFGRCRQIR